MKRRVLVIRLSALGDFVLSFGPFAAIRAHWPDAEITLLTTAPFADMARAAPWFDHVIVNSRPRWGNLAALWRLSKELQGFNFVVDLQTSSRSNRYFYLAGRPRWNGNARGCTHRQSDPARETMHTVERQRAQLRIVGITKFPRPDISWLTGTPIGALLPDGIKRIALLVPGAAPSRPAKRWPVHNFAEVAEYLDAWGLTPVVIGAQSDAALGALIATACPAAIDLTGKTSLEQIFALAARASVAVGNDTGPMHIAAATGCKCVVLFSGDSDPQLTAPRGPDGQWPVVLREEVLADLPVARVARVLP